MRILRHERGNPDTEYAEAYTTSSRPPTLLVVLWWFRKRWAGGRDGRAGLGERPHPLAEGDAGAGGGGSAEMSAVNRVVDKRGDGRTGEGAVGSARVVSESGRSGVGMGCEWGPGGVRVRCERGVNGRVPGWGGVAE
jgi:hypothetical protein